MELVAFKSCKELKIKKPKKLNNKTLIGSIPRFIGKNLKLMNKVYKVENDYYIHIIEWCRIGLWQQHMKMGTIDYGDEVAEAHKPDDRFKITQESIIKFNHNDWQSSSWNRFYPDVLTRQFNELKGFEWYETAYSEVFDRFFDLVGLEKLKDKDESLQYKKVGLFMDCIS